MSKCAENQCDLPQNQQFAKLVIFTLILLFLSHFCHIFVTRSCYVKNIVYFCIDKNEKFMARKKNTNDTALVQVYERVLPSGAIRFYLHYTQDGKRIKEPLKNIPLVFKANKQAYKESKQIAERIAAERIEGMRKGELGLTNRHKDLLLLDWCDTYTERVKSRVRSERYPLMVESVKDVIREYSGEKTRLQDVDRNYILGFINYVRNIYTIKAGAQHRGEHLKPSTAQKKCVIFSSILKEAVKGDILRKNPFDEIERADKIDVPETDSRGLTKEELKRMMDTPTKSERTKQVFLFMCFCGLRISDVKKLRWSEIRNEGDRYTMRIRQKKTEKLVAVPLSANALKYLPENTGESEFVFPSLPVEQTMNRSVKIWAKNAGIADFEKMHLHTARHTFGSMLANMGVDVTITAKLMGDEVRTVSRYYIHIADDTKQRAIRMLDTNFE